MSKTTKKKATASSVATTKTQLLSLKNWNIGLAVLYAAQAVALLVVSTGKSYPVTTTFLGKDTLASQVAGHSVVVSATRHIADIPLVWLVATFLLISAVVCVVRYWLNDDYEADLKGRRSSLRFIGYGLSAGVMTGIIGLISGVSDVSALILLFGFQMAAGLTWWAADRLAGKAPSWMLYWTGVAVGIVPWVVFAIYASSNLVYGNGVAGWITAIYDSMFALFVLFAANMWLSRKKVNRWKDFIFGERIFLVLALVAQTALAWQLFVGALQP
ncbi:MAG TPA: heliorhodopsin HeR [Candidatus Saccharimonadales bacterium]|nr:heliorhodopsin HeR [Candidatus Saccharimonadales bacterium]